MAKLIDIKGYWYTKIAPASCVRDDDHDCWKGKLLLEEDGWFEGIVTDTPSPLNPYDGDRMIFGIYYPSKIIELFKISPAYVSDPFVFTVKRDVKDCGGVYEALCKSGRVPLGFSDIVTRDVEFLQQDNYANLLNPDVYSAVSQRNIDSEKGDLLKKINNFKANNDFKELYENILSAKKQLSEIFLLIYERTYDGGCLSLEEKQKIAEVIEPLYKDNRKLSREEIAQLINKRNEERYKYYVKYIKK